MHHFRFLQNKLYCENLPIGKIVEQVETPFYLYSKKTILDNFEMMEKSFQDLDHLICFALKANSNINLLSLLSDKGAGADVVSRGEIYLALKSGFDPDKIVFAGVGKRDDEIRYAIEKEILAFNTESLQEISVINKIAEELKAITQVAIRINPNIDVHGHPYIATGRAEDKFGIELEEARAILKDLKRFPHIKVIGFHCHLGSQIMNVNPYFEAIKVLKDLIEEVRSLGIFPKFVDIGGGLGVQYVLSENSQSKKALSSNDLISQLLPKLKELECKIIFEPGRSLIAEAGVLVTKVLFTKQTKGKLFVIVDAGMNDLIRPSLYNAYHEIIPIRKTLNEKVCVDVVGPICESGDFLARDRLLPQVQRGDILAVMTAGAYGYSLSSNYNARPRPAEILVDMDGYTVIRERQKVENL